jgi:hypothetical protein
MNRKSPRRKMREQQEQRRRLFRPWLENLDQRIVLASDLFALQRVHQQVKSPRFSFASLDEALSANN